MVKLCDKKDLINIITKHIPNCKIYLFGSRARKTARPGSDIDIALETNKVIDRHVIGSIKEDIEESNVPFCVDVVDLNNVSEEMKKQILKEGIIWQDL